MALKVLLRQTTPYEFCPSLPGIPGLKHTIYIHAFAHSSLFSLKAFPSSGNELQFELQLQDSGQTYLTCEVIRLRPAGLLSHSCGLLEYWACFH